MTQQIDYDYDKVEQTLKAMSAPLSPEEMHGLMTGWLCVNSDESEEWKTILFPELVLAPELAEIFEETALQLGDDEFGFELLLPCDDESLVKRGKALTSWCQGFLAGLGLTGFNIQSIETIQEPIQDLSEIAKLDYDGLDENSEEDLAAFEEVSEYVRVSVMLVFTEVFMKKHKGVSTEGKGSLH